MKSDFHFHFYSRIFILLILAVSLLMIQQSVRSKAEITAFPYEVIGWAWNDSARWISLNCYNDFDTPGEYFSTCYAPNPNYKLEIDSVADVGTITGCAWSGNNLSGGASPLGYICFSDLLKDYRPGGTPLAGLEVVTSSTYLNAIEPGSFASILAYEDWRCTGTNDNDGDGFGDRDNIRCQPGSGFCSEEGGTCTYANNPSDERWKLGFPILKTASSDNEAPSTVDPIEGCFNCYEEKVYGCQSDNFWSVDANDEVVGLTECVPSVDCGTAENPDPCVVKYVKKKCDNCLEYFNYPGRCEDGSGNVSATMGCTDEFLINQDDCCVRNDDCNQAIGETCKPVYTLTVNYVTAVDEYNCTEDRLNDSGHPCTLCPSSPYGNCGYRDVGSFRKVIGAYDCKKCDIENYDNRCILNADRKNLNNCKVCDSSWYYPGVMIDNKHYNLDVGAGERAYMCGWAWNGWDETADGVADNGLFWFQFSPRVVTSTRPFLSVDFGNIYSQKGIVADYLPPFGYYNASYLIESGGNITNFITSSTLSGIYQGEVPYQPIIEFPSLVSGGKYANALGSIDYNGLTTDVDPDVLAINKYGSIIISLADGSTAFTAPVVGVDQVYHRTGNLTLGIAGGGSDIVIQDGTSVSGQVAAKTVIVEGNLTIRDNIKYETGNTYDNFREIPSIVWIVFGDVIVDDEVSEVVGTFIVLGNGGNCNESTGGPDAGCGQFITCDDSVAGANCSNLPLVVKGNVMAKYFSLTRTYANQATPIPAEQFINDGRLRINPPGGFSDFSKIIPRFTNN